MRIGGRLQIGVQPEEVHFAAEGFARGVADDDDGNKEEEAGQPCVCDQRRGERPPRLMVVQVVLQRKG